MPDQVRPKYTQVQQAAIDSIRALLEIEAKTSVVTRKARNQVMQKLDPSALAVIARELNNLNI